MNQWYLQHKDLVKARARQWALANPEKMEQCRRNWRQNNPGKVLAQARKHGKKYYAQHREERLAYQKERWRDPEVRRKWNEWRRFQYWEKRRFYNNQREIRLRGAVGKVTFQEWLDLLKKFDYKCAYCGGRPARLTQDHVIPIAKGGPNIIDNIVPACQSCNSKKGTKIPEVRLFAS